MLTPTKYTVDTSLFKEACQSLPEQDMKTTINQPTGNFFYDPWVLKDEYKGTVWETIYNSLDVTKGEARIIILDPGQCYQEHADIDDRYHLNILGDSSYLINLVQEIMYPLSQDGIWYDMDASFIHSATNFGRRARVQLVVRHLLKKNKLTNPVKITISTEMSNTNYARFLFDNTMSSWLNSANKNKFINDFTYTPTSVSFNLEQEHLDNLKKYLPEEFKLI
jgi:hypothetical protein